MTRLIITTLPLSEADRDALIQCANETFEKVMDRIKPANPTGTRRLWNADAYVESVVKEDMLPIERDYALHLVEAFLVHHVVDLAVEADAN